MTFRKSMVFGIELDIITSQVQCNKNRLNLSLSGLKYDRLATAYIFCKATSVYFWDCFYRWNF